MLGAGEEIRLEEIERELAVKPAVDEPLVKQDLLALPLREAREQFERAYLQQQLLLCNGKVGQLAKRVGMERTHLYRKLRALGVDFRQLGGGGRHLSGGAFGKPNVAVGNSADLRLRLQAGEDLQVRGAHVA